MARAQLITEVAADMPLGHYAARVLEVRGAEVDALLADRRALPPPELIHDRRVAIRRLRTALAVFADMLPSRRTKRARRQLKALAGGMGGRRDADVMLAVLRALEPSLAAPDVRGWRGLIDAVDAAVPAPTPASGAGSPDLDLRLDEIVARARRCGGPPAAATLGPAAARSLAELSARVAAGGSGDDAEALHDLRLAAKRTRYELEAAAPVLGETAERAAAVARELQDVLGEIHDRDVLLTTLGAHRDRLKAADVEALRAGRRAPHATAYRGLHTVEALVLVERLGLIDRLERRRDAWAARLEAAGEELSR